MINKATFCVDLTTVELKELLSIKDWSGKQWDKPPSENISDIKDKIRTQLESVQTSCAYCGLKLKGTSRRSEEHTSELQSRPHLVCRLLLEKKNKNSRTKRRLLSDEA